MLFDNSANLDIIQLEINRVNVIEIEHQLLVQVEQEYRVEFISRTNKY